jgi:hypothetical protein
MMVGATDAAACKMRFALSKVLASEALPSKRPPLSHPPQMNAKGAKDIENVCGSHEVNQDSLSMQPYHDIELSGVGSNGVILL